MFAAAKSNYLRIITCHPKLFCLSRTSKRIYSMPQKKQLAHLFLSDKIFHKGKYLEKKKKKFQQVYIFLEYSCPNFLLLSWSPNVHQMFNKLFFVKKWQHNECDLLFSNKSDMRSSFSEILYQILSVRGNKQNVVPYWTLWK